MAYRVIRLFADSQDNNHIYQVGDVYPRPDLVVSDARLSQLVSNGNSTHTQLIEWENDEPVAKIPQDNEILSHDESEESGEVNSTTENSEGSEAQKTASRRGRKKKAVDVDA